MADYSNNTGDSRPQQGRGGRGRRNNNRSGGNRGGFRSDRPSENREPRPPQQTGLQKFLHVITFGVLGKPKAKTSSRRPEPNRTPREPGPVARSDREQRTARPERPNREARPPRPSPVSAEVTSERLYVGNLSYDATESDLFELFKGTGRVKNAEVVVNNHTQRSKGFAFVTMMTTDEAKKAVADLNNKDFMGRPLIVGGAKPMPAREDRPERGERRERPQREDRPQREEHAPVEDQQSREEAIAAAEEAHEKATTAA